MENNKGRRSPFKTLRSRLIAAVIAVVVISAVIAVTVICVNTDKRSRQYSGEDADTSFQVVLNVGLLGEYEVIDTNYYADDRLSEHIIGNNAVDIRVWRDFTRPRMSLKKQIKEKYPKMSGYSKQALGKDSTLSERADFSAKGETGTVYRHTVVLLRKKGWDYLLDFAVKDEESEKYSDYIDNLIEGLIYL